MFFRQLILLVLLPVFALANPCRLGLDSEGSLMYQGINFYEITPTEAEELREFGIRPDIFSAQEMMGPFLKHTDLGNLNLSLRKLSPENDPKQLMTTLWPEKVASKPFVFSGQNFFSSDRSQLLLEEIQKKSETGQYLFFSRSTEDTELLPREYLQYVNGRKSQIPSQVFLNAALKRFFSLYKLSSNSENYLKQVIASMLSPLQAANEYELDSELWLNQILIRWKSNGKGKDFDDFHKDTNTITSTSALVGHGSELLLPIDGGVEIQVVNTGDISYFLGTDNIPMLSRKGIIHRASTDHDGPRLVILLFFNRK